MPNFFDDNNFSDFNDSLSEVKDKEFSLDEQIANLEEEINAEVEKSELVDSFLSAPIPVFDLKVPDGLISKFIYNRYVNDEYSNESAYEDDFGNKIYGVDPRVILLEWNTWSSGLKEEQINKDNVISFINSNNFNVDILQKFLRVKLSSYHIGNVLENDVIDHIDKNNYSISFNLKHFSELSLQSRENFLSYINLENDIQDTIYDSAIEDKIGHKNFDWKDYLFESVLNMNDEELFESSDNTYETDPTVGIDTNQNIDFDYIGFYIKKERIEDDGTINRNYDPIIILGTDVSRFRDVEVMYGKRYRYKIASLGRFVFQTIDENGDSVLGKAYVRSAFKFSKIISCKGSPFVDPPVDIRMFYKGISKKLFIHWHPPRDVARKTAGYIIYIRDSISKPYRMLRAFDFTPEGYDRKQFADIDINFNKDMLVRTPNNEILSTEFDVRFKNKFYLAMSCFGVHNEISSYSEQFLINIDSITGLSIKRISRSGASLGMPNIYIDKIIEGEESIYHRVRKDIVASEFDKFTLVFNPEARYYAISSDNGVALHNVFESSVAENFFQLAKYNANKRYYHMNVTDLNLNQTKSSLFVIHNEESQD